MGPIEDAGDGCGVRPLAFGKFAIDFGSFARKGVEGFPGLRTERGSKKK
ncbi:MAG: hypothetical protein NTW74_05625 [Acidobacteria bacterium]|nr:hypothetical protein [Acidobacteriota bacterium]